MSNVRPYAEFTDHSRTETAASARISTHTILTYCTQGTRKLPLVIREFTPTDAELFLAVVRHLQAYERELYDRMMPVESIGPWYIETLVRQCSEEDGVILVAELNGRIEGFATIFKKAEAKGEIDELPFTFGFISHIAVSPEAQGAGVGKKLMQECERHAREAGCKWLRVPVLAKNQRARVIYEKLGFSDHHITLEKSLT